MNQQDPNSLARMLGVDPDIDPDRLRAAYEQEMNRATRSGDHRRALSLSQAFDALPGRTRSSVYSGNRTFATVMPHEEFPVRSRRGSAQAARPSRPRRRVRWKGVLGYGVIVPAIVGLLAWSIVRQNSEDGYSPPPRQTSPIVVQPPPGPALVVPAAAPTTSNGLVRVLCQTDPAAPGFVLMVSPGARVTCANSATPVVIAP
jgi:hypothetical protein